MILLFGFLLGISDGKIALWKAGNSQPVKVFPYRVQMLPAADQSALQHGIHIYNEEELNHLLEDYLS